MSEQHIAESDALRLAEESFRHSWDMSDERLIGGAWVAGLCCECGDFVPYGQEVAHIAAALAPLIDGVTTDAAEKDRMRGTGGNRFIPADATRADLMRTINDQLGDLHEWATETDRVFDLAEVTISTRRIPSGLISVSVTADLADDGTRVIPPAETTTEAAQ